MDKNAKLLGALVGLKISKEVLISLRSTKLLFFGAAVTVM